MGYYSRKKSILSTVLFILISIAACFFLSACGLGKLNKLTNESGVVVEGGSFKKGAVVESRVLDETSEDFRLALSLISSQSYDKTKPVYAFDLSVLKGGVKVQPKGKVTVTIPISEDLTDYLVLHIKDDGKVERLALTYERGSATFETDSFSVFAFVKKASSGGGESGGNEGESVGESEGDGVVKHSFHTIARRIIPSSFNQGGSVLDVDGEHITYMDLSLAEGSQYTVKSLCATDDYYFIGWYEASELEEASEQTLISKEPVYTFTITRDINVCAIFAHKEDTVELKLGADGEGFSYRDGKPTLTLVAKGAADAPDPEKVEVLGIRADGNETSYSSKYSDSYFEKYIVFDDGGLDYSKTGTYTVSYALKRNENVKATLDVQVVESGRTLKVSTPDNNLKFRYNVGSQLNEIEKVIPTGRLVTLTAEAKKGYSFAGWRDESGNLVSKDLVYCFEMPDRDFTLRGEYQAGSALLKFTVWYSQGELVDGFGNACVWSGESEAYFRVGDVVGFTVRERGAYEFLGWYDVTGDSSVLITAEKTLTLTIDRSRSVEAKFRERLKYMEVDSEDLSNEGFVNGRIGLVVGDDAVDYESFRVNARGVAGSYTTLSSDDYTIDDGSIDFNFAGEYSITYAYKYDARIDTQIKIVVIDPKNVRFEYSRGYSYLDHEYDGKATFVSPRDVKANGIPLSEFKSTSEIWDKISYKWIDKKTNEKVDSTDADITINGVVVKNFGPEDDKTTIGNEFGGPVKAGSYRFEFFYDGASAFTQDSTISTRVYKKISTKEEFKTNEGSSWVNFELYYYTIVGYADGAYYVMQAPTVGYGNYEAEAREVQTDADGNVIIGDGNDFAFVNARYYAYDTSGYTEFLTGYYGSYVVRSSSNTIDGTTFGSPYIYRTGYTSLSGGRIYREYGTKEYYGMKTSFGANGAVAVYSRYYNETENNRLRLVKDGNRYEFTSVPEDTDERESYDVFIYRSIIQTAD